MIKATLFLQTMLNVRTLALGLIWNRELEIKDTTANFHERKSKSIAQETSYMAKAGCRRLGFDPFDLDIA